jgi:hypothetical protein
MTLTTHALVGAAAASIFPHHPYMAFTAAFASHLAIDALPHWDYQAWLRSVERDMLDPLLTDMRWGRDLWRDVAIIGTDALLGTILAVLVFGWWFGLSVPIALVGAWAGVFPDFLMFAYYKLRTVWLGKLLEPLQQLHIRLQMGKHRYGWGAVKGLFMQSLVVVVAVWAAYLAHF